MYLVAAHHNVQDRVWVLHRCSNHNFGDIAVKKGLQSLPAPPSTASLPSIFTAAAARADLSTSWLCLSAVGLLPQCFHTWHSARGGSEAHLVRNLPEASSTISTDMAAQSTCSTQPQGISGIRPTPTYGGGISSRSNLGWRTLSTVRYRDVRVPESQQETFTAYFRLTSPGPCKPSGHLAAVLTQRILLQKTGRGAHHEHCHISADKPRTRRRTRR